MKDFFISYNKTDQTVAEWVGWVLEEEGYSVVLQSWDFRPGENFILEMHRAAAETRSTVALLSANYLASDYARQELAAALASDPQGDRRRLIPIRVGEFKSEGLLSSIVYADIVGLPEEEARRAVLQALDDRAKPDAPPPFPSPTTSPSFHAAAVELEPGESWHQPAARFRPTRRLSCTVTFTLITIAVFGVGALVWYMLSNAEAVRASRLVAMAELHQQNVTLYTENSLLRGVLLSRELDAGDAAGAKAILDQIVKDIDGVLWESGAARDNLAMAAERNVNPEFKEYISLKLRAAQGTKDALLSYRNTLAVEVAPDLDAAAGGDAAALARARLKLSGANASYVAGIRQSHTLEQQAAEVAARFPDKIQVTRSN